MRTCTFYMSLLYWLLFVDNYFCCCFQQYISPVNSSHFLIWYYDTIWILNLHSWTLIVFQHYLCWHFPTYKIGIVWEIPILFPNTFEQFPTKRGQILRYITSTSLMIWNGSYVHTLSNILHVVFLYLLSSSVRTHAFQYSSHRFLIPTFQ